MVSLTPMAVRHAPTGMVCSIDHLASGAGVAMLRSGGTAVDAAVAASAVLAVTSQHMCGMGGDLFALVHHSPGAPEVLNASGRAGSGADPERLRSEGHTIMPLHGDIRSVPVPGCVDGWITLHDRFGRLPLSDVLAPAVGYADDGFPASRLLVELLPLIADVPGAEELVGQPVAAGDLVRRRGVARALRTVADAGRGGFYGGEFGEGLLELGAGEYEAADLAEPCADWVPALGIRAWDHDLWTVPPNSQGYLTLTSAWIADHLDLPDDPDDPQWAHLLVESAKQAGLDRPHVLHENADGAALLDDDRLRARADAVDPGRAREVRLPSREGDTIFLCAVDGDRTGVSLIQSNALGFGAHLAEPATGIMLQNRGLGFSLEPGHPAEYGPRRRPPHTLSPVLVTKSDGSLHSVVGAMGGDSQPQVLLQILARLLSARQQPHQAIAGPRWVLSGGGAFRLWEEADPVAVRIEADAPDRWASGLRALGHHVEAATAFEGAFGHAHAIVADHVLAGAADPRSPVGSASGY